MRKGLILLLLLFTLIQQGQNYDLHWLKEMNNGNNTGLDQGMKGVSFSVYPVMPVTCISIWAHGHFSNNKELKSEAYKSALSIGLALGLTTGLKYAINRTRPYTEFPNEIIQREETGPYSFPSGHTTGAFSTATALSLTYKKWYVSVPAYLYAGMMGYSRMRLGVHYPSDVLGGAIIGIGSGILIWQIDKKIKKKKEKKISAAVE
ncbi:MAG: phosphatase PAP2 family protein [Sphingobacteriaceae bacterium]|nr:phosphatase PAP2 family protein [Sphingobacteriaceae bacterium]